MKKAPGLPGLSFAYHSSSLANSQELLCHKEVIGFVQLRSFGGLTSVFPGFSEEYSSNYICFVWVT